MSWQKGRKSLQVFFHSTDQEVKERRKLNKKQIELLAFLHEAGREGVSADELASKRGEIGFTDLDEADLILRGLWCKDKDHILRHPAYVNNGTNSVRHNVIAYLGVGEESAIKMVDGDEGRRVLERRSSEDLLAMIARTTPPTQAESDNMFDEVQAALNRRIKEASGPESMNEETLARLLEMTEAELFRARKAVLLTGKDQSTIERESVKTEILGIVGDYTPDMTNLKAEGILQGVREFTGRDPEDIETLS